MRASNQTCAALLDHLEQISERGGFGRLRVNKEYRGAARPFARRLVDDLEALLLQIVEGLADVGHTERHVRQAAAPAILFQLLGHGRFRRQRLQQLHQVRTVAYLQQHFAHLVAAQHIFAMHFLETHRLVRLHLRLQLARLDGDGHMVEKQKTRNLFHCCTHHSNSTRTWPACTLSPAFTLTAATRAGHRRGDLGLHLHGFQHQQFIANLQRFSCLAQ